MKSCGNCGYWSDEDDRGDGRKECKWPLPSLPFWATLDPHIDDHYDCTLIDDGKDCDVWKPK